jgi:hypothetical protein
MYAGSPDQQYSTPPRPSAFSQAAVNQMDALSNFSVPASALETAGKQDEVSREKMQTALPKFIFLCHLETEQLFRW